MITNQQALRHIIIFKELLTIPRILRGIALVEDIGIEPITPSLQS